jgi:endoglucanase
VKISDQLESEAIHANQVGFAPGDEAKVAFMSCWLGTGGALIQSDRTPFYIVDKQSKVVFKGNGTITKRNSDNESTEENPRNLNLTDVVMFDFSEIKTPGEFRLIVPGIGSSFPITIAEGMWLKAFTHVMKYFYIQRSGLELKPPYTNFNRPRNIHPADGVKITQSTLTLMDSNNGLRARGPEMGSFKALSDGDTGQEIGPDAWGGYADSGDWDRRIQHLQATRLHLDLLLEGGELFSKIKLDIPESGNGMPDILNEALWNLDFYRKLMTPEGGVRGGIEAEEHPKTGEGSWQESWHHFAYAPDAWSSYLFASTAARCAHFAEGKYPQIAGLYQEAAVRAMNWAEKELIRLPEVYAGNKMRSGVSEILSQVRNLAAADLYRCTGSKRWHELFLETFNARNSESSWVYLRTNFDLDKVKVEDCRNELIQSALQVLDEQQKVAFRWVRRKAGAENGAWGLFTRAEGSEVLIRAWQLTGDAKYRKAAILSAQMVLGANPNNMTYISGLGRNPMQHIHYYDTEVQGLETPAGLVAFGPFNPNSDNKTFNGQVQREAPYFVPEYRSWPQTEFCIDSGLVHPIDEHLPDLTGWVVYLYGALANNIVT